MCVNKIRVSMDIYSVLRMILWHKGMPFTKLSSKHSSAMDTIQTYRNVIKKILLRYAKLRPSHGDIRVDPVFDETRDHYTLTE